MKIGDKVKIIFADDEGVIVSIAANSKYVPQYEVKWDKWSLFRKRKTWETPERIMLIDRQ